MTAYRMKPPMHGLGIRAGHPLATGLVVYGPFWKGGGPTAMDATQNRHDGTLTNMEESDWQDGPAGSILAFNGGTNWLDFGASSLGGFTLDAIAGNEWTAAWRAKVDATNTGTMLARAGGAAESERTFQVLLSGDELLVYLKGLLNLSVVADVNDGLFHHYATTWDGTIANFYRDGVFVKTLNVGANAAVNNNIAYGARANGTGYVLSGSQVGVLVGWGVALTASQVSQFTADPYALITPPSTMTLFAGMGGAATGNRRRRFFMGAA